MAAVRGSAMLFAARRCGYKETQTTPDFFIGASCTMIETGGPREKETNALSELRI
jgi:hypothetical protein